MDNISDKEIYQAAQALLDKYNNDEWQALNFVLMQWARYSETTNDNMLCITFRISEAIRTLAIQDVTSITTLN